MGRRCSVMSSRKQRKTRTMLRRRQNKRQRLRRIAWSAARACSRQGMVRFAVEDCFLLIYHQTMDPYTHRKSLLVVLRRNVLSYRRRQRGCQKKTYSFCWQPRKQTTQATRRWSAFMLPWVHVCEGFPFSDCCETAACLDVRVQPVRSLYKEICRSQVWPGRVVGGGLRVVGGLAGLQVGCTLHTVVVVHLKHWCGSP